ncbi:MAG: hypothetical protein IKC45_08220 [Clostridia bacterium]|nr:hypothetical protein [Clostridia bacterium]
MGLGRMIVDTGSKVADFFAFGLQNKYYWYLFNRELAHFEGINNPLSVDYQKKIDDLWKKRYNIRVDKRWFAHFTHCYGEESPYYIPDNIFHSIIEPYFNRDEYVRCMSNKNYFEKWLPDLKHVVTIVRNVKNVWYDADFNVLTAEQVVEKLSTYNECVAKPSVDSAGGAGVQFITEKMDVQKLLELKNSFTNDFVIQEVLKQHECLNEIYPYSVNTIRIMTFNWHGKIHVLSPLLRMGVNGKRVDNMVSGGVNCAIRPDGTLCNKLYNAIGTLFEGHPNSGSMDDKKIENFQAVVDAACTSHKQLPYMGIISWDFALNQEGEPVLVEFNMKPQGLDLHQRENGPLFGDMTVAVLDEVFADRMK